MKIPGQLAESEWSTQPVVFEDGTGAVVLRWHSPELPGGVLAFVLDGEHVRELLTGLAATADQAASMVERWRALSAAGGVS